MKDDNVASRLRRGAGVDQSVRLFLMLVAALTMAATLSSVFGETPLAPASAWAQVGSCGNGFLDPGEDCDLSSPAGAFCPPGQVCDSSCDCVFVATTTQPTTTVVPTTTTPTTSTVTTSTTLPNHFQCYEIKKGPKAPISGVTIVDQFGSSTATLTRSTRLCAPTNKRGEDPTAPQDPDHLKGYDDSHNRARVANQVITNQFGTVTVDVTKPKFLLVPAAKGLNAAPPPLVGPTSDHFQCYRIKRSRGTPRFNRINGVAAADQFGSYTVDLVRPRWLCAPANKNNEDPTAPTHPSHLLCYKTKTQRFTERTVFTNDQFISTTARLIKRWELCVPSLKNAGVTTTTTSTTVPTTTVVTTTVATTTVPTTTVVTTTIVTTTVTTSTTTTTTLYGSPSRAFVDPVRSLLD